VIFLGPPGVGKTHLSVALAEAAIQAGFGAYFITAHDLVADLSKAIREGRLQRRMRIYLAPKVLIIDECEVASNVELHAESPANRPSGDSQLHI
jgi:DNA replication protein DnaC